MEQEQLTSKDAHPNQVETSVESHPGDAWATQPAPRRRASLSRDGFDLDAIKIFFILAALTAGMALAIGSLF